MAFLNQIFSLCKVWNGGIVLGVCLCIFFIIPVRGRVVPAGVFSLSTVWEWYLYPFNSEK